MSKGFIFALAISFLIFFLIIGYFLFTYANDEAFCKAYGGWGAAGSCKCTRGSIIIHGDVLISPEEISNNINKTYWFAQLDLPKGNNETQLNYLYEAYQLQISVLPFLERYYKEQIAQDFNYNTGYKVECPTEPRVVPYEHNSQ